MKRHFQFLIFLTIVFFMLFSLWIRGLSVVSTDMTHYFAARSPDIWYNLRQIELMIQNFPQYPWFDPMTAYPFGKSIDWGPLLPFVASAICILAGMTSRSDMMSTVAWIGPVLASAMVPVLYVLGKQLWDWKTGIVSAGLISIFSGIFFIESTFGNIDHHILETFISTIFCLLYITTITYWVKHSQDLKNHRILISGTILSLSTGMVYFIGYLNMPTIILFGLMVALYTIIQFSVDKIRNKRSEYLIITNLIVYSPVIILMLIFGVQSEGLSLQQYSVAQILAISAIIIETILVYILSEKFQNNNKLYVLSIIGLIVALMLISRVFLGDLVFSQLSNFFGLEPELSTIIESQSWSISKAYNSFNLALALAMMGFIYLLYQFFLKKRQGHLFLVIWSLIVFFATIQHFRFEYYLAVNIALLSSLCIVVGIHTGLKWLDPGMKFFRAPESTQKNSAPENEEIPIKDKKNHRRKDKKSHLHGTKRSSQSKRYIGAGLLVVIIIVSVLTVALSVQQDIRYSTTPGPQINKNWIETLQWLTLHTKDPGVDYNKIFDKENFTYPKQSYGVLAWWDYGHYITFFSKRIPNTNPFQDNLIGPSGVAAFFMSDSEYNGTKILNKLGSKYIITDTSIATEKFSSVATWFDDETGVYPYMKSFYIHDPVQKDKLLKLNMEFEPYFQTILVRLHNYDGSMILPNNTIYLEYYNENRGGLMYPIVTKSQILPVNETQLLIQQFYANKQGDLSATEAGQFLQPVRKLPALQHFRLVYESSGNSSGLSVYDISKIDSLNYVKVFEYVPGARIKGDGIIELRIVTNTGRNFTYRQESENGEFIVPYSTLNNPYDVRADGTYHIVGTSAEIDVTEDDVLQGHEIYPGIPTGNS